MTRIICQSLLMLHELTDIRGYGRFLDQPVEHDGTGLANRELAYLCSLISKHRPCKQVHWGHRGKYPTVVPAADTVVRPREHADDCR